MEVIATMIAPKNRHKILLSHASYPPEVEADRAHLDVETIPVSALDVIALHPVVVLKMADDGLNGRSSIQFGLHVRGEPLAPRHTNFPGRWSRSARFRVCVRHKGRRAGHRHAARTCPPARSGW